MRYSVSYWCTSHAGKVRSINQDNYVCAERIMPTDDTSKILDDTVKPKKGLLLGVFDGLGGEELGEVASHIAAKVASELKIKKDSVKTLSKYCENANQAICDYALDNSISSMGTTAAVILFSKKNITVCNVGDSKILYFSDGKLEQISKDHVSIAVYGTKPPLSQNLGIPTDVLTIEPYFSQGDYVDGDKYLICSDGLTDMVGFEDIEKILSEQCGKDCVSLLLDTALQNGGKDNITIILVEISKSKNKFLKASKKI